MPETLTHTPEWISEEETAKWLGVTKNTLFKWRSSKGLAWTNINGKTIMYDRRQIEAMLYDNSTYSVGQKKAS